MLRHIFSYAGARKYAQLARAVFPTWGSAPASVLVGIWALWVQGGRAVVGLTIASRLVGGFILAASSPGSC
jgi:hypothetical protein